MIAEYRTDIFEKLRLLEPSKVVVPDVVDFTIVQPKGVKLHVTGPKQDCQIVFQSPQGEVSLNFIPPQTRFELGSSPYDIFCHRVSGEEHITVIPPLRSLHSAEPVLAILHEKGHVRGDQDSEWAQRMSEARHELQAQLFSRMIDGLMWLDKNPDKRERERAALGVLLEEEVRASNFAMQKVAEYRAQGIDLVPHRGTTKELLEYLDMARETQNHANFAVAIGRRKESFYDRTVNKLLGVQPRDENATVYIPNWDGVQRRWLFNWVVRSTRMVTTWAVGTAFGGEAVNYLAYGNTSPDKFVMFGIIGVLGGILTTYQMVDPRQRF